LELFLLVRDGAFGRLDAALLMGAGDDRTATRAADLSPVGKARRLVILHGMTHRVGAKGQVVIPKDLRERLGIHPGSEVVFDEADGAVRVIPLGRPSSLRGRFRGSGMAKRLEADRRAEPR